MLSQCPFVCIHMNLLNAVILATYACQIIQITFFPVPSAGSTLEMLFKVPRHSGQSIQHPAAAMRQSIPKMIAAMTATLLVTAASLIPLMVIFFPLAYRHLGPLVEAPTFSMVLISIVLLVTGNLLTIVAVATLRSHVAFKPYGETTQLYTAGIYRIIRNPISVGLAAISGGFLLAFPSVVLLIGLVLFLLNTEYRIRMEEAYLQRTFGDTYMQYRNRVGKYFPKVIRATQSRQGREQKTIKN